MDRLILASLVAASFAGCATAQAPRTTVAELSSQLSTGRFQTVYDSAGNLTQCEVTRSTGDVDLDHAFCEIARACAAGKEVKAGTGGDSCMDRKQAEVFARIVAQRNDASSR